jgi:hypothetical protein
MLAPTVVAGKPAWQIKITQQKAFSILSIAKDDFLLMRDAVTRPINPDPLSPRRQPSTISRAMASR